MRRGRGAGAHDRGGPPPGWGRAPAATAALVLLALSPGCANACDEHVERARACGVDESAEAARWAACTRESEACARCLNDHGCAALASGEARLACLDRCPLEE